MPLPPNSTVFVGVTRRRLYAEMVDGSREAAPSTRDAALAADEAAAPTAAAADGAEAAAQEHALDEAPSTLEPTRPLPTPPPPPLSTLVLPPDQLVVGTGDERAGWRAKVYQRHASLRELRTRISPFDRATAFAAAYDVGSQLIKETVTRNVILDLILQHLSVSGLRASRRAVVEGSGMAYVHRDLDSSALVEHLHVALRRAEQVTNYTLYPEEFAVLDDAEGRLLEHLTELGIESPDDVEESLDVDIWADQTSRVVREEESSALLVNVLAGTLNDLVALLTAGTTKDAVDQLNFTRVLLMTYRSFTSPERLLNKLIQRYAVPASHAREKTPIQLRVVNVIRFWIENYYFDWTVKLQQQLNAFTPTISPSLSKKLAMALQKGQHNQDGATDVSVHATNTSADESAAAAASNARVLPDPKVPRNIWSSKLKLFDIDDEELARQITLHDFAVYIKLTPSEFLNRAWINPKYRHRARNVLAMRAWTSNLTMWAGYQVAQRDKLRDCSRIAVRLINVATHLRAIGNFLSSSAIVLGLARTKSTLKNVWADLSRKEATAYHVLEKFFAKSHNYAEYRNGARLQAPPKIPYISVGLADLIEIDNKHPAREFGDLINFKKSRLVHDAIADLLQYQHDTFYFQEVYQIQQLLNKMDKIDERSLLRSLQAAATRLG